jgi:hypothetical protein
VTDPQPIACTLDENDLRQRLEQIATLGANALIAHEETNGTHTLRFRRNDETHRQLEEIVAAESQCCSFLDLSLGEHDGELILALDAPIESRPVADELARTFSAKR